MSRRYSRATNESRDAITRDVREREMVQYMTMARDLATLEWCHARFKGVAKAKIDRAYSEAVARRGGLL